MMGMQRQAAMEKAADRCLQTRAGCGAEACRKRVGAGRISGV